MFVLSGVHAAQAEIESMENVNVKKYNTLKQKYLSIVNDYNKKIRELLDYYIYIINHISLQYRKTSIFIKDTCDILINITKSLRFSDEVRSFLKELKEFSQYIKKNNCNIRKITDELLYNIAKTSECIIYINYSIT